MIDAPPDSTAPRVRFLAGQAFALGLTTAWILIPASAIFLAAYGPELLPVTYIGAAVAGGVSSVLLGSASHRRPVADVAIRVLAGVAITLLLSWIVLSVGGGDWVSFALLVFVPIVVPVGFVFIVGQAGLLLDVRVLKARYARVVAGFALGSVAGGLGAPLLLGLLARTEDLLLAAALAAMLFLGLVASTRRRFPTELAVVEATPTETERPTVRTLTRHRFVMLIVAFQMLSAVESQWLDFLVFDRAAQRYQEQAELARFIGRFSAIAYGADIVFLVVVAGLLLRRFGLRYGLVANGAGVLAVLVAIVGFSATLGSGATIVFVMIVAARVTDLTFSDGTSRTSLSAAYQAVPSRLRPVAQAAVEGLGVPLAIGASGVVLLAVQSVGGTDGLILPILTALVVVAWIVVAVMLYREYRVSLLANLRGRALDPRELTVDDHSSLLVIDRLVESPNERDVRLGLDILTIAQHPELPVRLQRLLTDERVIVRTDALERLVMLAPHLAAAAARDGLGDQIPAVRAASIRVLVAAGHDLDLSAIAAAASDPAADVKVAVAFAVTSKGSDPARNLLDVEITRLARSRSATERAVAAAMIGAFSRGSNTRRDHLADLIADADATVVRAALDAVCLPVDVHLLDAVLEQLHDRHTAAAAADALVRFGHAALEIVDEGLRAERTDPHVSESLVRVARQIGGAPATALLCRHVDHPNREVGLAVMQALAVLGPPDADYSDPSAATSGLTPADAPTIGRDDFEHATHILRALDAFAGESVAALQNAALRNEMELIRARVLAALSLHHESEGMHRVVFQLDQRDARSHALALEWLDLALTGTDRAAITLLEPIRSDADRLSGLSRWFPIGPATRHEILVDLVSDPSNRWRRPWIAACALYTASAIAAVDLDVVMRAATERATSNDDGIIAETLTGIRARAATRSQREESVGRASPT